MVANGHLNGFFVMAVKLRLKRVGARNTPAYRIVATDGRNRRDGRPKEELGTYEPLSKNTPNKEEALNQLQSSYLQIEILTIGP